MLRHGDAKRMELAQKCYQIRCMSGYTQEEVASECGCTHSLVSQMETGKTFSETLFHWYMDHGLIFILEREKRGDGKWQVRK